MSILQALPLYSTDLMWMLNLSKNHSGELHASSFCFNVQINKNRACSHVTSLSRVTMLVTTCCELMPIHAPSLPSARQTNMQINPHSNCPPQGLTRVVHAANCIDVVNFGESLSVGIFCLQLVALVSSRIMKVNATACQMLLAAASLVSRKTPWRFDPDLARI